VDLAGEFREKKQWKKSTQKTKFLVDKTAKTGAKKGPKKDLSNPRWGGA